MSCVLHFVGNAADVAELERLCPINPCNVFRKGQPRSSRPNARLAATSGVSFEASSADFDNLEQQQAEALAFLKLHHANLQAMRAVPGVEAASIDFGIAMRNVFVQSDCFHPDLIVEVARLKMQLVLSQYPPQGRAKRAKQYRRALRSAA